MLAGREDLTAPTGRARAAALAALAAVAALLCLAGGALTSDLGAFEDEPAHVATGLMIRDWLAGGTGVAPVRFAEDYYSLYPKVAVGQWPPAFHVLLAAWTLVLGVSGPVIVLLGWALALGAAWVVARVLAPRVGLLGGALAGAVLLGLPLVQELAGAAMTEVPMALAGTLAVLALARWIDAPTPARALAFGALAAAAILTKGSGLALALVPALALPLARRPRLVLRRDLWLAAALVAVVCAPWYTLTLPLTRSTWAAGTAPTLDYLRRCLVYYPPEVAALTGWPLLALAALGAVRGLARRTPHALEAVLVAWLVALAVLHAAVPSSLEARHLVPAAPALVILAALGAHGALAALRPGLSPRAAGSLACVALAALFALTRFDVPGKDWQGFSAATAAVREDPALAGASVLVASGAAGEGLAVIGFALDDAPRGERQVLRASKVLAHAGWIGQDYRARFADVEGTLGWLEDVPVAAVLLDRSTPPRHRRAHQDRLAEALEADADRGGWRRVRAFDVVRAGVHHPAALELWVQPDHARRAPRRLGLDEVLGRELPQF